MINTLTRAVEGAKRHTQPTEALREQLGEAERSYHALMIELRKKNKQFVAVQPAMAISSKQTAESPTLDKRTAIVGWAEYGDMAWGFVARKSGVKWVKLRAWKKEERGRLIRSIRSFGAAAGSGGASDATASLEGAYRLRIKPLEKHLTGVEKLIIIAQDWAALVPAEMLLTAPLEKAEQDLSAWPWLCKKYEISYAPSVTTFDILVRQRIKRKAKVWPKLLFAMADPPFSTEQLARMKSEKEPPPGQLLASADPAKRSDSMLTRMLRFDDQAVPNRLPGTRREARMIAGLLGAKQSLLLLGPDASERKLFEAVKTGKLKECRYIHLATHGFADSDRPELSGLVLARVPPDRRYDGILHMREVFHLKLDADLVVLSACQTGLGKNMGGEGVVGLSTAFFFAGTPSVVMSLWNVPDAPTALLMHRFYSNLKANKAKAAALREAKNWLRNLTSEGLKKLGRVDPMLGQLTRGLGEAIESDKGRLLGTTPFAHPHYWAGFILTGDPQ